MTRTIVDLDLIAVEPTGEARPIVIRVGAPAREPTGEWSCSMEILGLFDVLVPMRGADALQALCLALGLCASLLRSHTASGGRLHYVDGSAFPIDAYFGWLYPVGPTA